MEVVHWINWLLYSLIFIVFYCFGIKLKFITYNFFNIQTGRNMSRTSHRTSIYSKPTFCIILSIIKALFQITISKPNSLALCRHTAITWLPMPDHVFWQKIHFLYSQIVSASFFKRTTPAELLFSHYFRQHNKPIGLIVFSNIKSKYGSA
jgi:hypothetical protein